MNSWRLEFRRPGWGPTSTALLYKSWRFVGRNPGFCSSLVSVGTDDRMLVNF